MTKVASRPKAARSAPLALHLAEPAAAYARRPRLVADASVFAATLFAEDGQAEAVALLQGRALVAPHLLDYEIASVALNKLRRGHLEEATAHASLDHFAALGIERHAIEGHAGLARRYGLTAYDAAYLWLAERLEAPLATFDASLARAARLHLAGGAAGSG